MSTEKWDTLVYGVPADWARRAHADATKYGSMYASSASTPDAFWAEHGKRIDWIKPFTKVKNTSFAPGEVSFISKSLLLSRRRPACAPGRARSSPP